MANLNKVLLMGNLTRDPQNRAIQQTGTPVCEMAMAVNRRYKTQSGEEREDVIYVDLTVYGHQADYCVKNMKKGTAIYVEGHLRYETWQDKDTGKNRSKLRVVVDNILNLDRNSAQTPEQQYYQQVGYPQQQPPYPAQPYGQPMPNYGYQPQQPAYPPVQQPYQPLPQQPYQPAPQPQPVVPPPQQPVQTVQPKQLAPQPVAQQQPTTQQAAQLPSQPAQAPAQQPSAQPLSSTQPSNVDQQQQPASKSPPMPEQPAQTPLQSSQTADPESVVDDMPF